MAAMVRFHHSPPIRLDWAFPAAVDRPFQDQQEPPIRWECIDVHWRLAAELLVHQMYGTGLDDRGGPC